MLNSMNFEEPTPLACSDKLAFDTTKQAQAAATVASYQRGVSLTAYKCRDCGLWHLSTA